MNKVSNIISQRHIIKMNYLLMLFNVKFSRKTTKLKWQEPLINEKICWFPAADIGQFHLL